MHKVSLGLHQHFVYNRAIIRSTDYGWRGRYFLWYLLNATAEIPHLREPFFAQNWKQFYDVKTIFREQIVLLVKGVQKDAGTFYKLLSGRSSLPFPSKVCKTFYKWLSSRSKRFFPSCLCTCTRHIGPLTQMPREEERERGRHSLYQNDNKTQIH